MQYSSIGNFNSHNLLTRNCNSVGVSESLSSRHRDSIVAFNSKHQMAISDHFDTQLRIPIFGLHFTFNLFEQNRLSAILNGLSELNGTPCRGWIEGFIYYYLFFLIIFPFTSGVFSLPVIGMHLLHPKHALLRAILANLPLKALRPSIWAMMGPYKSEAKVCSR
ncbi:hypothetical protein TNCT_586891 [Trichonephila clavata]|uniref:Uncharacterized protein n=1 Tax=Trichonephila clavata TaxID=2740835 RepID=A0A8X6LRN4_TRICU|nr:hypothetical protein TNCT_586891 [Trichonephila clavata]